jgi:hypothetical protein
MDTLHDHLSTLNEDTPRIKVSSESPITPDLVFGLDTQLFSRQGEEGVDWEKIAGGGGWHGDEVETKTIWKGGTRPGKGKEHVHAEGEACGDCSKDEGRTEEKGDIRPITKEILETALSKLSFEIYRGKFPIVFRTFDADDTVKGIVRLSNPSEPWYTTYILNYAFGRHELTPVPELDTKAEFNGVSVRLTIMGERGEVARRAKHLAESLGEGFLVA